jgi:YHS domain-containing protein
VTDPAAGIKAGITEVAMEALLYFALWAGFIFLMMRFGCGSHIMGHGHGNGQAHNSPEKAGNLELRWTPPKKDTDPVCGKTVTTDKAKPSVYAGNVYYFCSRDCREAFEAAPDIYVNGGDPKQSKLEHSRA